VGNKFNFECNIYFNEGETIMVNWSAVTTPTQLMNLPNENTGGSYWISILYMLWVILMLVFARFGFEIAILSSSFLCLVMGIFLAYAGLIAFEWCLFFLGVILFMFLYIVWSSNKN